MSDAPATLADLLSPLPVPEFLSRLRRRELFYQPGSGGDRYAPLLGWQALRRLLETGDHPKGHNDIRVTRESVAAPVDRWMPGGKVETAKLDDLLAKGFSIIVVHIEPHVPALAALCQDIRSRTSEGSYVGVIVTSGTAAGAFRTHFDPEDLLILQLEGTKRWQIFGPAVPNPLRGMPKEPEPGTEPIFDEVLEPGDMLFVPAGNWHHCENGLGTSVHLGVFFLPPASWHAVRQLIQPLLSEEAFRTPLTRFEDPAALEAMEARIKARLAERINELNLREFLPGWSKAAY